MIIGLDHVGLSGPVSKHCFGAGQGGHPRTEQWKSQVMARSRSLVGASISRQLQGRQCQNRASIHEHTSTITTSKSTTSLYNKQGTSCLHDVRCTSTAHINSLRSVTPSAHRQPSPPPAPANDKKDSGPGGRRRMDQTRVRTTYCELPCNNLNSNAGREFENRIDQHVLLQASIKWRV